MISRNMDYIKDTDTPTHPSLDLDPSSWKSQLMPSPPSSPVAYHCPCEPPSAEHAYHDLLTLYFCEECDSVRCPFCVLDEVSSYYCPNCLFEVPAASVRAEKNRSVQVIRA